MNKLRNYNKYILDECNKFIFKEDLATPLLVSSDNKYINGLNKKILYVGQETNGWLNYNNKFFNPSVEEVENGYIKFLKEKGTNNKDFWDFIRKCLNISREEMSKNIIWSNTIISSKRQGLGHPKITNELEKVSVDYLTYLYNYFKPDYTILVNGPNNPYYKITIEFLKNIKSNLINDWPNKNTPLLIDYSKNIMWTYHPNYLNRSGLKNDVIKKVKKIIN